MSTDQTERVGVEAVRAMIAQLGWFVREPVRPDYGVDLFVETSSADGRPTGRLLALQVKAGGSYVDTGDSDNIELRVDERHLDYWNGHALPVVVVVYDPDTGRAHWQAIRDETAVSTGKGRKVIVPRRQLLDEAALSPLAVLAAPRPPQSSPEADALSRLRSDLTWMQVLDAGGTVRLDAREWINKVSGRGDLSLTARPHGKEGTVTRQFVVFAGRRRYSEALPDLFPWAELHADEDLLEKGDEDLWMEETGIWDGEDKQYIGNIETLEEWRASRFGDRLRPYANEAGEVDHWRLWLRLNDLGRAVLSLERYLSTVDP